MSQEDRGLPVWARETAERMLAAELPRRWAHTKGVAAQARAVGPVLAWDTDLIEAAAWVHDIGYASALAVTGFHPLDGARYLRDEEGAAPALCALVAHHSGAMVEAAERGLGDVLLAEFPLADVSDKQVIAITYCDFTTGPSGERLTPKERVKEILSRYEPGSPVHRAVKTSAPRLLDQCREVKTALHIKQVVDTAPPLTAEQIELLRRLLPAPEQHDAPPTHPEVDGGAVHPRARGMPTTRSGEPEGPGTIR